MILHHFSDAALLSLGYDAGLRVSELTRVEATHIDAQDDGSATLFIPFSKTDQEQEGAWAWLSAETMRRVALWQAESAIEDFKKVSPPVWTQSRRTRSSRPVT